MRVGKKYLFLLIVLLFIFISFKFVSASCLPSGTNYICSSDTDCCSGTCYEGPTTSYCKGSYCGDGTCDSDENCHSCYADCGCPSGEVCKLEDGSYSCVPDFTVGNGVCEYGAGERMTSNAYDSDDCDQDNDGYYDNCDGFDDHLCFSINTLTKKIIPAKDQDGNYMNKDFLDYCPGSSSSYHDTSGYVLVDDKGCTCRQKQNGLYRANGVEKCDLVTCGFYFQCAEDNPADDCSEDHPNCYTFSEICDPVIKYDGKACEINDNEGYCKDGFCNTEDTITCTYDCTKLNEDNECKNYTGEVSDSFHALNCSSEIIKNALENLCEPTILTNKACSGGLGFCNSTGYCISCPSVANGTGYYNGSSGECEIRCNDGYSLIDNNCLQNCDENNPCPEGYTCENNVCQLSSCGDGTCDSNENCNNCQADCGCADDESCENNRCEPKCKGDSTYEDGNCVCKDNSLIYNDGACVECLNNTYCADDEYCENNSCEPVICNSLDEPKNHGCEPRKISIRISAQKDSEGYYQVVRGHSLRITYNPTTYEVLIIGNVIYNSPEITVTKDGKLITSGYGEVDFTPAESGTYEVTVDNQGTNTTEELPIKVVDDCESGLTLCNDECVNPEEDPNNCGACDNQCGDTELCINGECEECSLILSTNDAIIELLLKQTNTVRYYFELSCNESRVDPELEYLDDHEGFNYQPLDDGFYLFTFNKTVMNNPLVSLTASYETNNRTFTNEFSFQFSCEGLECCDDNGNSWDQGAPCKTITGLPGTCDDKGDCEVDCDYNTTSVCEDNKVVVKNLCEETINTYDCPVGEHCEGGACVKNQDSCEGTINDCENNEVVIKDGCGNIVSRTECPIGEKCVMNDEGPSCQPSCDPEQLYCEGTGCVNPEEDPNNCGACNNQCADNEACIFGECQEQEYCHIACKSDNDCEEGEVCLNPGDCYTSRCSSSEPLTTNETTLKEIINAYNLSSMVKIKYQVVGDKVLFRLTNYAGVPLNNISFITKFDSFVLPDVNKLFIKGITYDILSTKEPTIRVHIPKLTNDYEFTATLGRPLIPSFVRFISVKNLTVSPVSINSFKESFNNAKKTLGLGVVYKEEDGKTSVKLSLNPKGVLTGVSVPVMIPKCMAQYASQLELKGEYQIVQDDPLIVWQFDKLSEGSSIEFQIPKTISEDCKKELKALSLVNDYDQPLNPFLPLLLIPIVASLLLFNHLGGKGRKKLSKKEFFRIAKEQGLSKEEAERDWADYQLRFGGD